MAYRCDVVTIGSTATTRFSLKSDSIVPIFSKFNSRNFRYTMYNRNFRVSALRPNSEEFVRKSLSYKGFGDQESTMMRSGHLWARVILLACCAMGSKAFAQDVLINPTGTLESVGTDLSTGFDMGFADGANLLPVQYEYGGGGPYGFQGGPGGAVYERPIPNQRMVFSGNPNDRQYYSYEGLFFRMEYLNWDFKSPNSVMGESTLLTKNITKPFLIDPYTTTTVTGYGEVSTLDSLNLHNSNGVRGTFGVPLTFGSFEGSAFGFHIAEETFNAGTIDASSVHPLRLNSLTLGGDTTDLFRIYTADYNVNYTSKLYGAEANLIFDGTGSNFLTFNPIAGFRFMNLSETMEESGIFESSSVSAFRSEVNSYTLNNMYLPQAGVRVQFETKWFTLQFDPKVAIGLNDNSNKVSSVNYTAPGDAYLESKQNAKSFMQMVDLGMTGRVPVSERFSITLGYNFLWMGQISRASHNVAYNINTDGSNDVHVDPRLTDMFFQGGSIGGEFVYR